MTDVLDRLKTALADRYTIEYELGAGGMATVYLAEDLKHHRKVAVKVLRPELAAAIGPERFLREIEIAANLTHPHILPLHDSGDANGFLYYVMPYIDGETLRDRINREKQLPVEDAVKITSEVATALSFAHRHDVVHRDIKPENILLEAGIAVVADFGIAKAIRAAGGEQLTETGMSVGTPTYMSPEQASGSRDLDGRSDLYSLGCVLYEMLAGVPPFVGPTAESVVHQHMTAAAPSVTVIREQVPVEIAEAVSRALAKTPADRFRTAQDLGEALTAPPSVSTPMERGAPTGATPSRWSTWAAVAISVVVIVGGWQIARMLTDDGGAADTPTIAVLALDNFTGDPEREYLVESMTDQITAELGKVSGLFVKSRTSAMSFKDSGLLLTEIGSQLGARYLVEGSLGPVTDSVRVTVQVIDATEDRQVWSGSYEGGLSDGFALSQEIARAIAEATQVVLTSDEQIRLGDARQVDPEAYDAFQRGMYYYNQGGALRSGTVDDALRNLDLSIGYFESAIKTDAGWAKAYAMLARAYHWRGSNPATPFGLSVEFYEKSKAAADEAIVLDDTEQEAYLALAFVTNWLDRDWTRAEEYYRRASLLNPNYPRWGHALGLLRNGRVDEAVDMYTLAQAQAPNSLLLKAQAAWANSCAGNYDAALREAITVVELNPDLMQGQRELGRTYLVMGIHDEAIRALQRAVALGSDDADLGYAYALAGFPDQARDILAARADRGGQFRFSPGIWIGLGETDKALEELTEMDRIDTWAGLRCAVWYEEIREDERFGDLIKRFASDHVRG